MTTWPLYVLAVATFGIPAVIAVAAQAWWYWKDRRKNESERNDCPRTL